MVEEIARWRKKEKTGKHLFVFQGKRKTILPGDFVTCPEHALGNQLKHYDRMSGKDATVTINGDKVSPVDVEIIPIKTLKIVRVSRGLYNVINPDNPDKPLNDKPLKKEEAEKLIKASPVNELLSVDELDWDQLVTLMSDRGIDILPEYETEDDLRQALIENNG